VANSSSRSNALRRCARASACRMTEIRALPSSSVIAGSGERASE
jgi:hypothetical protein